MTRAVITLTNAAGEKQEVLADDPWNELARRLGMAERLAPYPMMAVFGEVAGAVGGFPYDSKIVNGKRETCFYAFDVFDVKAGRYLDYDDRVAFIKEVGLTPVPELYRGFFPGKEALFALAEGKTMTGGKHIREGWVLNTAKEHYEPRLHSRMSVKLVGEAYNISK